MKLKGKGIFVFSDPGGAKPILSLIKLSEFVDPLVISDRVYDFYSDFGIIVKPYISDSEDSIFENYKPDYVYTGTSYTSKIELKFIKTAKKRDIPTYSYVDHYTSFLERFNYNNEYIYPDTICVLDERAKSIAINNNTSSNILITNNSYLTYLKSWVPSLSKEDFFKENNIPSDHKLMVFAPDPLSNINGKAKYGFDETDITNNLIDALNNNADQFSKTILGIKLHPNQKKENILPLIQKIRSVKVIVLENVHTNSLLYFSDVVIGMFSNILIESLVLKKNVVRILIGLTAEDPLFDNKVGQIAKTPKELEATLISSLH